MDGLRDFVDHALPLLTAYGFRADMHIVTGHVGGKERLGDSGISQLPVDGLADDPRSSARHRHDRFSHRQSMPALAGLDPATVMDEMLRSRLELEQRLGRQVTRIAYPWGSTDESIRSLAVAAGYDYAFTINDRFADLECNRRDIPRLEIRGGLSIAQFGGLVTNARAAGPFARCPESGAAAAAAELV